MISILYISSNFYKEGMLMTLMESWKDSLRVFTPQGLKEFASATWRAMKEVGHIFYARWFIIVAALFSVIGFIVGNVLGALALLAGLLIPLVFLAMLPVPQTKDFNYFMRYLGKYTWALLKLVALGLLLLITVVLLVGLGIMVIGLLGKMVGLFAVGSSSRAFLATFWVGTLGFLLGIVAIAVGPTQLVLFFYFTKNITIRSAVKKSLLFVWYNFPLMVLCMLIEVILVGGVEFTLGKASLLYPILMVCIVCVSMVLYIQRINAQPALYQ
jgi:hypothetical protein